MQLLFTSVRSKSAEPKRGSMNGFQLAAQDNACDMLDPIWLCASVCVCVCGCVRACACVRVRASVRAWVCVCVCASWRVPFSSSISRTSTRFTGHPNKEQGTVFLRNGDSLNCTDELAKLLRTLSATSYLKLGRVISFFLPSFLSLTWVHVAEQGSNNKATKPSICWLMSTRRTQPLKTTCFFLFVGTPFWLRGREGHQSVLIGYVSNILVCLSASPNF